MQFYKNLWNYIGTLKNVKWSEQQISQHESHTDLYFNMKLFPSSNISMTDRWVHFLQNVGLRQLFMKLFISYPFEILLTTGYTQCGLLIVSVAFITIFWFWCYTSFIIYHHLLVNVKSSMAMARSSPEENRQPLFVVSIINYFQ